MRSSRKFQIWTFYWMLLRATENAVAGHIWHACRYLPTPAIYQSSLQCDFCIAIHLATRSVTKGRTWPPWKNFIPPEEMSWTYCTHNHCFRACYQCKIWVFLRKFFPPWCPKLVRDLLVTVALWLLSVMPLSSVFLQSNFSGLTLNFSRRNYRQKFYSRLIHA